MSSNDDNGTNGTNGTNGINGTNGTHGTNGTNDTNDPNGPKASSPPPPSSSSMTKTERMVIIAAIDRSSVSEPVAQTAVTLAKTLGAEIHFVHVLAAVPDVPMLPPTAAFLRAGRVFVDGIAKTAAERCQRPVVGHLLAGETYQQILQLASDLHADLIIVGSHGKGALDRLVLGSVSTAVFKKACCAVLIARAKSYPVATASDVPEIEPPCPMCVETQQKSHGEKLWCTQHSGRALHGHLYNEGPASFGVGSMFIRP